MEKHIQLVGILNITYRAMLILVSFVLFVVAAMFKPFMEMIMRTGGVDMHDFPFEIMEIVPLIIVVVAVLMLLVSVVGVVAGIGVLGRKRWGRVLMLVISFFNLLRIPFGTLLGGYSIWVLLQDETIKLFDAGKTGS